MALLERETEAAKWDRLVAAGLRQPLNIGSYEVANKAWLLETRKRNNERINDRIRARKLGYRPDPFQRPREVSMARLLKPTK